MKYSARTAAGAAAAVLALSGIPAAIVTIRPAGQANADVCASAGRRVTVSGCANLGDVMAPYAGFGFSNSMCVLHWAVATRR